MRTAAVAVWMSCAASFAAAQDFTTLKGHGGPIMGIAVSPSGQVATASFDNSVGLWEGRAPTWLEGHDAAVIAVNYSRAPLLLTGGDDFRVLAWAPGAAPQEITRHQGKVSDIAVSPAGVIASASWDGSIRITPTEGDGHSLTDHRSNVTSVAFAPDGTLYSASSDGTIRVWNGTGAQAGLDGSRIVVSHGFGINEMVVTETWIAYGAVDGGTRVIDRYTETEIADLTLDRRPILAMDWHAPTGQLAVGDGHGYIMMLDTDGWRIARDFRAMRQGPVWALAFSTDGSVIHAGGLDDVVYAWPVALLGEFDAVDGGTRDFLRPPETMPNGERQFARKCSICHDLTPGPSRRAGPTLHGVFGRQAGTVPGYPYSDLLSNSDIIWSAETIDALFDIGPDHYIPGSKMPMQVIAGAQDRADLITYLQKATSGE